MYSDLFIYIYIIQCSIHHIFPWCLMWKFFYVALLTCDVKKYINWNFSWNLKMVHFLSSHFLNLTFFINSPIKTYKFVLSDGKKHITNFPCRKTKNYIDVGLIWCMMWVPTSKSNMQFYVNLMLTMYSTSYITKQIPEQMSRTLITSSPVWLEWKKASYDYMV